MSRSVYIASPEGASGKSTVALGLLNLLTLRVGRVGVFRPVYESPDVVDTVVELLLSHPAVEQEYGDAIGVSYAQWHADPEGSLSDIVNRFHELSARYDMVLVQGSDYTDVTTGSEMAVNSAVAANLGAPVVLVVHGRDRTPAQIRAAVAVARTELTAAYAHPVAVIANRVDPDQLDEVRDLLVADGGLAVGAIPEIPVLVAPTVKALLEACGGRMVRGNPAWLERESLGFVVAAMSLPNVLTRLHEDCTVIAPGDRSDLLPGLILAHHSGTFPHLSSIVLTGGYAPPEPIAQLIDGIQQDLPIIVCDHGTFETASILSGVRGKLEAGSRVKTETALRAFADGVDSEALLAAMDVGVAAVTTPLMFQFQLMEQARADRKHVVLPEADDDRVLRAAASLLRLGVADLTLLGDEKAVRTRASGIGVDLSGARVVSPDDAELVERFAQEYTRLRAHKGMTVERAREVVTDVSYFGTMMVHLGMADGMVSGAAHTTAHTIRPSFEIIKTSPGTAIVSSVFLMCLADRVLVYGDCAVNPDPTAQELADIAISSAATAAQFGVEPRVAMLSYSTGASGSGADVDKVRQATEIVRSVRPDLSVDGPIQYDAAVDPTVAAAKLPDSPVAGRATVLIFPDLNTGNNTYKAVQRSANAVAIGPVLQGLNRPVNDLSRGALVADIVNTVVITAVQAQGQTLAAEQEAGSMSRNPGTGTGTTGSAVPDGPAAAMVLVVNSGSSSMKYQLVDPVSAQVMASGLIERIGDEAGAATHEADGERSTFAGPIADHGAALEIMRGLFAESGHDLDEAGLTAVGHRVVHGGDVFADPVLVEDEVLARIRELSALAPLHNPAAATGIERSREAFPGIPQVAVFDTAFFRTLPPAAFTYAIDADIAAEHRIRRYGFHGTSHQYVSGQVALTLGRDVADLDQIVLHLGNGASASAIAGGVAVETSMGLTPLEGLVMGTRSGDIDPAWLLHLGRTAGMGPDELDTLLNRRSGLLGLAGVNDFRDVQSRMGSGDERARLAFDVYCHRVRKYVGAYLAVLGGADVLTFTAGVGENAPLVRAGVVAGMGRLGIEIDPERNAVRSKEARVISTDASTVTVMVVPTNEELAIARATAMLVQAAVIVEAQE